MSRPERPGSRSAGECQQYLPSPATRLTARSWRRCGRMAGPCYRPPSTVCRPAAHEDSARRRSGSADLGAAGAAWPVVPASYLGGYESMRAIWKGTVSFGLVSIPVSLYAATASKDIAFHQVHVADNGRIHNKRICSVDGSEVPYTEIAKGYETPGGELVVLTDDDLASLPVPSARSIEVQEFLP